MSSNSSANVSHDAYVKLSVYCDTLNRKARARLFDMAIHGEAVARDLLELALGFGDLKNLNLLACHDAIDLASDGHACAIQVSLTVDTDKIVETQEKFFARSLDQRYSRLMFLALGTKPKRYKSSRIVKEQGDFKFDPSKDVIDLTDILQGLVLSGDVSSVRQFADRLDRELTGLTPKPADSSLSVNHLQPTGPRPKRGDPTLSVNRIHQLFEAHQVKPVYATQALSAFGVTRFVLADDEAFTNAAKPQLLDYVAHEFGVGNEWLDGTYDCIYIGSRGSEQGAFWRNDLSYAYSLVSKAFSEAERLLLFMPAGPTLLDRESAQDCVDHNDADYESFFLVARKPNDFKIERYRVVINDTFSYRKCRDGLFLLMLAASLYRAANPSTVTYIDLWVCDAEVMKQCNKGERFVADLYLNGCLFRNNLDFFYPGGGHMNATSDVPPRVVAWLQESIAAFAARSGLRIPATII